MTRSDYQKGRIWAALLSLPSIVALTIFGIGKVVEALGNRSFGNDQTLGLVLMITFILIPFTTLILVGWAIARWANHGVVSGWLLAAVAGNSVTFWIFYEMTTM